MWHRIKATLICRLTFFVVLATFVGAAIVTCNDSDPEPTAASTPTAVSTDTPAPNTEAQRVEVGDTSMLVWEGGEPGVILVHGAVYDADSWTPQAQEIAGAGMTAISVEQASAEGILLALEYARADLGVGDFALVGASAGAPSVLSMASEMDDIAGVIILAGTGNASGLPDIPALFIAAEDDGGAADRMRQMAAEAPGDAETLIVSGDAHAQAIFSTPQGDDVMSEIIAWLQELE